MLRFLIPLCLCSYLATACRARIDNRDEREQSRGDEPQTVTPTEDPAEVPTPKTALDPATLTFLETNIDLLGDFRVKKVERDEAGSYYVAFVTDAPSYALMKFDATGKELWRFPTLENSTVGSNTPDKVGSYLLGNLADMNVTAKGDVWLLGLRDVGIDVTPLAASLANGGAVTWKATQSTGPKDYLFANVAFLSRIAGGGTTADSPKVAFETRLAAPLWWMPLAIRIGEGDEIALESSSGGVQQVQVFDSTFSKVRSSACFATANSHVAQGKDRLMSVLFAAPQAVVENMAAPLSAPFTSAEAGEAEFKKAALAHLQSESGRCWDLIGTRVMPKGNEAFRIHEPSMLAAGQPSASRVETLGDLISGENAFEEYDFAFPGSPRFFAGPGELLFLGLAESDLVGKRELVLGNGRSIKSKGWNANLETNSLRAPESLALLSTSGSQELIAAWTDLHLQGETNEGNRALRLMRLPGRSPEQHQASFAAFEVPTTTGHSSYSSVQLAEASGGKLAVFATVGTRDLEKSGIMKQATLLIGFTK